MATLTLARVQAAIERCRAAHPTTAPEYAMHPDENRMADVFSRMLVGRLNTIESGEVDADVLALIDQWNGSAASPAEQREG